MNRIEKDQKKEVIRRLLDGDSPGDLISEYGINERTIYTWSSVINVIREILKEEERAASTSSAEEISVLKQDISELKEQMMIINRLVSNNLVYSMTPRMEKEKLDEFERKYVESLKAEEARRNKSHDGE